MGPLLRIGRCVVVLALLSHIASYTPKQTPLLDPLCHPSSAFATQAFILPLLQTLQSYSRQSRCATLVAASLLILHLSGSPTHAQTANAFVYQRPGVQIVLDALPGSKLRITNTEFQQWQEFFDNVPNDHLSLLNGKLRYAVTTDKAKDVEWDNLETRVFQRPGLGGPAPIYFSRGLGLEVFKRLVFEEDRSEWQIVGRGALFEWEYPLWTRRSYFVPINNALHRLLRDPSDHLALQKSLFMAAVFNQRIRIEATPEVLQVGPYQFRRNAAGELIEVGLPLLEIQDDSLLRDLPERVIRFEPVPLPKILLRRLPEQPVVQTHPSQRHLVTAS